MQTVLNRRRDEPKWMAVCAYLIVMGAFIWLIDSGRSCGKPELSFAAIAVVAADPHGESLRVFFGMALYAPFEAVLLALGVGARQVFELLRCKRESAQ
jgi:hypothetical protein